MQILLLLIGVLFNVIWLRTLKRELIKGTNYRLIGVLLAYLLFFMMILIGFELDKINVFVAFVMLMSWAMTGLLSWPEIWRFIKIYRQYID